MKYIRKTKPPPEIIQYAKLKGATFADCPHKAVWRTNLLKEQGFLCGFTMRRIEDEPLQVKIAHILPRNGTPETDLNHWNVIACCKGNEGRPLPEQYADTRQGNRPLEFISPLQQSCERLVTYRENGEIRCDDENVRREIIDDPPYCDSKLNLNHPDLINGRLGAYDAVKRTLSTRVRGGAWRVQDIREMIDLFSGRDKQGRFFEYCNFVVFRLEKELKRRDKKR